MYHEAVILSNAQARILYDALCTYQVDNELMLSGWTISERTNDTELLTHMLTVWGDVEQIKQTLCDCFEIHKKYD